MLIAVFLTILVVLVLGGAIFLHQGGIWMCEDTGMLKIALGSFFALYVVTAIGLKVFLPPLTDQGVTMRSVTGFWTERFTGLGVDMAAFNPMNLFTRGNQF